MQMGYGHLFSYWLIPGVVSPKFRQTAQEQRRVFCLPQLCRGHKDDRQVYAAGLHWLTSGARLEAM